MSRVPCDHTGKVFGQLTALSCLGGDDRGNYRWLCRCTCGTIKPVLTASLVAGKTKSCGCAMASKVSAARTIHGGARSKGRIAPEYMVWQSMRGRCLNKKFKAYKYYGARGVTVCESWNRYENFIKDMGPRPGLDYSIERKDNNKGYSPDNCIWATKSEQVKNKSNNVRIEFRGETKILSEWARCVGLKRTTLKERLFSLGWSVEKALTTPCLHR